jgi:uncharacterized Zn-binding protein involved in type VI secretion
MGRPFIVIGDQTDHGGVVVGASGTTDTHGKRIARVGDQVTCPKKGHGTTVIVNGDPTMIIDGMPAARHGDKCACGATLISSQFVSTTSDGGASNPQAASAAQTASAAHLAQHSTPRMEVDETSGLFVLNHDQFFVLTDELTGEPLSHWKYRLTCGDKTVEGITDDSGQTQKIAAKEKSDVKIELLGVEAQA